MYTDCYETFMSDRVTFTRRRCKCRRALCFSTCMFCITNISCSLTLKDRIWPPLTFFVRAGVGLVVLQDFAGISLRISWNIGKSDRNLLIFNVTAFTHVFMQQWTILVTFIWGSIALASHFRPYQKCNKFITLFFCRISPPKLVQCDQVKVQQK